MIQGPALGMREKGTKRKRARSARSFAFPLGLQASVSGSPRPRGQKGTRLQVLAKNFGLRSGHIRGRKGCTQRALHWVKDNLIIWEMKEMLRESFGGLTEKRHAGSVCWKQQSLRPDWPGRFRVRRWKPLVAFSAGLTLAPGGCSVDCLPAHFAAAPAPDGRGLEPGHASKSPGATPRANPVSNPEAGESPDSEVRALGAPSAGNLPFRKVGRLIARVGRPTSPPAPPGTSMGYVSPLEPAARKGCA